MARRLLIANGWIRRVGAAASPMDAAYSSAVLLWGVVGLAYAGCVWKLARMAADDDAAPEVRVVLTDRSEAPSSASERYQQRVG